MTGRPERQHGSASAGETEAVGARLAAELRAGDAVVVQGEMGAGKTTLVRGACRALGVRAPVNSPTFTIGQRYQAPVPISHLDLFRVRDLAEEDPELLADYIGSDTISFVELPPLAAAASERIEAEIAALAEIKAWMTLSHAGGDRRKIELR